jgi:hypothetical protein
MEDHRTDPRVGGNDLLEVLFHCMLAAGQGGMDIPDVPLTASSHQRVQHRQDRGEPDPAAEQHQRPAVLGVQEKVAGVLAGAQETL